MKILIIAYQFSPIRGSEYSVGWNHVTRMSLDNEIVVLVGAAGDHMGNFDELHNITSNQLKNVCIKPVYPNLLARSINKLNKFGLSYMFYYAYRIWHWQAYKTAVKLLENENFDLIHYLNPIGYREPGYMWKLNKPYLWGPVSGAVNQPSILLVGLSLKDKLLSHIRNIINYLQFRYNLRLKKALNKTDLLLTATSANQLLFDKWYNKKSVYLAENAIMDSLLQKERRFLSLNPQETVNIVWIGKIDARKSLYILLNALKSVIPQNWHLTIIGNGPLKNTLQNKAVKLDINSKITWAGQIAREKVFEILGKSHLHVITSLSEGNPTTLWEAMSYGIPTISLDHCGMHDIICERCGIKIKIESYRQVVEDLTDKLLLIMNDPSILNLYSIGVNSCIDNYLWSKRVQLFNDLYSSTIKNWEERNSLLKKK